MHQWVMSSILLHMSNSTGLSLWAYIFISFQRQLNVSVMAIIFICERIVVFSSRTLVLSFQSYQNPGGGKLTSGLLILCVKPFVVNICINVHGILPNSYDIKFAVKKAIQILPVKSIAIIQGTELKLKSFLLATL